MLKAVASCTETEFTLTDNGESHNRIIICFQTSNSGRVSWVSAPPLEPLVLTMLAGYVSDVSASRFYLYMGKFVSYEGVCSRALDCIGFSGHGLAALLRSC